MTNLLMNFAILGIVIGMVFKVAGASEKIVEMMKTPMTIGTGGGNTIKEEQIIGDIELVDIDFRYPTKPDVQVSKKVNIHIKRGTVVALVGPSGCGKSSVIALI